MEKTDLTRSYLETLSSTDLLALSDDYGIDIPENLTRYYIISEILESIEDESSSSKIAPETESNEEALELPFSYNENKVVAILRNPAWCYVTWDFKHETFLEHSADPEFESFNIRLSYHCDKNTDEVSETFDIQLNPTDREQFVLLAAEYPSFHASLIASFENKEKVILATSQRILKPKIPLDISLAGIQKACSPVLKLSGLPAILKKHYNEHRHSFVKD